MTPEETEQSLPDMTEEQLFTIAIPRRVAWECDLFGLDCYTLRIEEGRKYPNWFWRKMQYLVFGNRWRRVSSD